VNLVKKIIGAFVEAPPPIHPLASIVETELKTGPLRGRIEEFLDTLPERPKVDAIHVVSVTETHATCHSRSRVKDHENPRYFDADVTFQVDLKSGVCRPITQA
jgi:hypothetical protein